MVTEERGWVSRCACCGYMPVREGWRLLANAMPCPDWIPTLIRRSGDSDTEFLVRVKGRWELG
jgi:hypothetical protein